MHASVQALFFLVFRPGPCPVLDPEATAWNKAQPLPSWNVLSSGRSYSAVPTAIA